MTVDRAIRWRTRRVAAALAVAASLGSIGATALAQSSKDDSKRDSKSTPNATDRSAPPTPGATKRFGDRALPPPRGHGAPAPPPAPRPALDIPPVPEVPGANALPEEDPDELAAREAARQAEADSSPRHSTSRPHLGVKGGPPVPAAPIPRPERSPLRPIEAQVADRNALSESLRVMPYEMRNPSGFTTLYAVDDRPEVMVRGNGAVYAVFPQGDYAYSVVRKRRVIQTLVPAGTVYYIGEPDWRKVWLPGRRPTFVEKTPEEIAAHTPASTAIHRVEPSMPNDCEGVYLSPMAFDDHPDYAPIDTMIDTWIEPSADAFSPFRAPGAAKGAATSSAPGRSGSARERAKPIDDAVASTQAPSAPNESGDEGVEPPIVADRIYRLERLRRLLAEAAQRGWVR